MQNHFSIRTVESRSDLKAFIKLPWGLHRGDPRWVPPFLMDEKRYLNPDKNLCFRYCDSVLFLAYKNGIPAGRIMGIVNHKYNSATGTRYARFALLDCLNEEEVATGLLKKVEDWARAYGMQRLIGPMGMFYLDPMGFRVEGHEHAPAISTYCNPEYMNGFMGKAGYDTDVNLVVYQIDLSDPVPGFYRRIHARISQRKEISLVTFHSKKEMKRAILPVMTLMNECFTEIYGYSQMDRAQMISEANKFITVLDPRLLVVANFGDEPAGFLIGMPNLSEGIRASGGSLLPFGWIPILRASKKATQLDLLIGGIKKKYQGIGIDVLMGHYMLETAKQIGFKMLDSHLELESNTKVRAEMLKLGGREYKRYTIYRKVL